jgi:molybdopterin-guanine dinucleotide biosynthesis protein A
MIVSLAAVPGDAEPGWPIRRLVERARLALLPCLPEARARIRGANTPAERAALLDDSSLTAPEALRTSR